MERDFLGISAAGKQKFLRNISGPNFLQNNPIFQPNMSNLPQFMSYRASKEERLEPINILDQFSSPRFHHLPPSIQTSPHLSQKNTGSRIIQHHPYAQHQIYPYHPTTNSTVKLQLAPPVAAPRNSPTGQLTIFYGTNVYVYDEIPVDKAQEIIYIANKNSKVAENVKNNDAQPLQPSEEVQDFNITVSETNVVNSNFSDFSSLLSAHSTTTDVADATASGRGTSRTMNQPNSSIPMSRAVPLARRASLARFLEKRKERMINDVNPYLNGKLGSGPSFEKSLLRGGEQRQSWCADKWKDCTVNRGMVVPNAKLEKYRI